MANARAPRIGLFVYAGCLAVEVLLGLASRLLMARMREGATFASISKLLDLVGYGYIAVGIGAVVALAVLAGRPRTAPVSRVAMAAAVAAGLGVVLELAQRVFITFGSMGSSGRMERAFEIFGAGTVLAETLEKGLVAVIAVRVGRAVGARTLAPVAVGALAAVLLAFAMYLLMLVRGREASAEGAASTIQTVAYYASAILVAAAAMHAGWSLPRVPVPAVATSTEPGFAETLPPRWRAAADGIALYLGGALARVVCAMLGYAAMAGGAGDTGTPDLRGMHDSVFVVAVLSGAASLTMLAGVWRITRAPPESGGTGPAMVTLCLMILGLATDLVTTSITLDALGGSLSAAFFAMDALPWLAAGATLLGVGAGMALLRSFGNMAKALGAEELNGRAKSATGLLVIGGGVAGLAMLGLKHMPVEVLGLVAVVVLPVAIAAVVQFLRVAVPLGRVIRGRLEGAT
jgi:hypothetical protein